MAAEGIGFELHFQFSVQYTEVSLGALVAGTHELTFKLYAIGQANSLDEGTFGISGMSLYSRGWPTQAATWKAEA